MVFRKHFRFSAHIPKNLLRLMGDQRKVLKKDRLDKFVTGAFPLFMVLAIPIAVFSYLRMEPQFTSACIAVCLGYVVSFMIFGFICFCMMNRGVVSWKKTLPLMLLLPLIISVLLYVTDVESYPSQFMIRFFNIFYTGEDSFFALAFSIYSIFTASYLVAVAVNAIISAYFRNYFYRAFIYIEKHRDPADQCRKKRMAYSFFRIPDIIDVESVEMDPETDDESFCGAQFKSVLVSDIFLGVMICSYIFLNPLFLGTLSGEGMILIGILMSMFIPAMVIPWCIVKSTGAYVKSSAKPYYLWKGMKSRMYEGFFAITFFFAILILSIYLGEDIARIVYTYLGYLAFMLLISTMSAFIYTNHFYTNFKNGIVTSFLEMKYADEKE